MKPVIWNECYDDGWQGFITKESFAHPAKYSRGLIERIFDHMLTCGWLHKGDVVGDCFGGIATGGVVAAYRGLRWVGVELEGRFVGLARANIALHKSKLEYLGRPLPTIIQGDSRKFAQIVGEIAGVVSSPPFGERTDGQGIAVTGDTSKSNGGKQLGRSSLVAIVSSPPYSETSVEKSSGGVDMRKNWETYRKSGGGSSFEAYKATQERHSDGYGSTEGQISKLKAGSIDSVVTSPPFRDARSDTAKSQPTRGGGPCAERHHTTQAGAGYGEQAGQIDNLATGNVDSVVTSPPWESNPEGVMKASKFKDPVAFAEQARKTGHGASLKAKLKAMAADEDRASYGETEGQIGQETKETYWAAMRDVYAQCFLAIKPGGYIAVVVKDYVKNKQRVPLCDDTVKLLEHCGFELVERIRAMLKTKTVHNDLFRKEGVTTVKSRASFFRRLAEKKGSPPIDWEEVLICKKPALIAEKNSPATEPQGDVDPVLPENAT